MCHSELLWLALGCCFHQHRLLLLDVSSFLSRWLPWRKRQLHSLLAPLESFPQRFRINFLDLGIHQVASHWIPRSILPASLWHRGGVLLPSIDLFLVWMSISANLRLQVLLELRWGVEAFVFAALVSTVEPEFVAALIAYQPEGHIPKHIWALPNLSLHELLLFSFQRLLKLSEWPLFGCLLCWISTGNTDGTLLTSLFIPLAILVWPRFFLAFCFRLFRPLLSFLLALNCVLLSRLGSHLAFTFSFGRFAFSLWRSLWTFGSLTGGWAFWAWALASGWRSSTLWLAMPTVFGNMSNFSTCITCFGTLTFSFPLNIAQIHRSGTTIINHWLRSLLFQEGNHFTTHLGVGVKPLDVEFKMFFKIFWYHSQQNCSKSLIWRFCLSSWFILNNVRFKSI